MCLLGWLTMLKRRTWAGRHLCADAPPPICIRLITADFPSETFTFATKRYNVFPGFLKSVSEQAPKYIIYTQVCSLVEAQNVFVVC